jgi:signal transduction histidine kinase
MGLLAIVLITATRGGAQALGAPAVGLAAGACAAVAVRRTAPRTAFVAAAVFAEAFLAASGSEAGLLVLAAPLVALYTIAQDDGWRPAAWFGAAAVALMLTLHATLRPEWASAQNVALLALGGLAVAAGEAARSRRAYVVLMRLRAEQAERGREQEARRRVTEERLRIARELHDVLGHHLALITVHAGAAADVLEERPEDARASLDHIREAGRTALAELRDVVVLLRAPEEPTAPTEPAGAGLAALDDLVAAFGGSGLLVERSVVGAPRAVPPAVDRTAYRVIQESLTNVAKHAGCAAAVVRLGYGPSALRVVVEDEGRGGELLPGVTAVGHGVAGMRERVAAVGGRLEVGPRPAGGFRVSASLPLPVAR